jgi:hypothetical protein
MENGTAAERTFPRGLGLGTHSRVSYALPAITYDRFECCVGLYAPLGAEDSVAFRIYADGEAVFDSGMMTGADASRKITLPAWRMCELSFDIEARGKSAPGKNHAVIAEPLLFKAKSPPVPDISGSAVARGNFPAHTAGIFSAATRSSVRRGTRMLNF